MAVLMMVPHWNIQHYTATFTIAWNNRHRDVMEPADQIY